jgi:hypothetical protein
MAGKFYRRPHHAAAFRDDALSAVEARTDGVPPTRPGALPPDAREDIPRQQNEKKPRKKWSRR